MRQGCQCSLRLRYAKYRASLGQRRGLILKVHHYLITAGLLALAACDAPIATDRTKGVAEPSAMVESASEGELAGLAPVMLDAPVMIVDTPSSSSSRTPRPAAGLVTAGDIDDALNFSEFVNYAASARQDTGLPFANLGRPLLAQIKGPNGQPAPGQRVTLRTPGSGAPFYDGYSGTDGMVTVFPAAFGVGALGRVEMRVFPDGAQSAVVNVLKTGGTRKSVTIPVDAGWSPEFLDLVFVVDATGSMGDELAFLTKELTSIVSTAARTAPGVDIRYGLVMYRDEGDDYVVRSFEFTGSARQMRRQLRAQSANGGGDYPEAAAAGLQAGVDMAWRRGKGERLMFHIADAPPHDEDARAYLNAAQTAAQNNIQIFGLGASGVAAESEFLMRQAALQTNGRYIFLTDDSGIGNSHAEPTISCYQVTALKSLLVRVLQSELSGQRVEPSESDVKRTVGTYRNGTCLN